eukprot:264021-Rhodomonas_salina.1
MWQRVKNFFYNDYYVPREAIRLPNPLLVTVIRHLFCGFDARVDGVARSEITAGLIVGLAVVPEAIAFALVVRSLDPRP